MEPIPTRRGRDWQPRVADAIPRFPPSTGQELEDALAAAERVLQTALEERRHAENRRVGAYSLVLTIVSVIGVLVAIAESAGFGRGLGAAAAVVVVFGLPATAVLVRTVLRASADQSARYEVATQIAAMVGDVFPEIARREDWSYFRREATRLRLAAFPLNPARTAPPVRSLANEPRE